VQFMRSVAPNAYILCMDISQTYLVAREAGHPVARELYADRDYDSTGFNRFHKAFGEAQPRHRGT
jgi:5-oxoprolinase (ATP-hydrolysing) subunit A